MSTILMGPYLGMNPVAKNGNMILKIQFPSLIIPILDGPNSDFRIPTAKLLQSKQNI